MPSEGEGADEVVQADPDGEEIEERLEEARYEKYPLTPVYEDIALDQAPRPRIGDEPDGGEPEKDGGVRCV